MKQTIMCVLFPVQEPTDSLEETLLLSQPDFSLGTENGSEEGDNLSGPHSDNPIHHSPDNARVYHFCTQSYKIQNTNNQMQGNFTFWLALKVDIL